MAGHEGEGSTPREADEQAAALAQLASLKLTEVMLG